MCRFCRKRFFQRHDCTNHERKHTGDVEGSSKTTRLGALHFVGNYWRFDFRWMLPEYPPMNNFDSRTRKWFTSHFIFASRINSFTIKLKRQKINLTWLFFECRKWMKILYNERKTNCQLLMQDESRIENAKAKKVKVNCNSSWPVRTGAQLKTQEPEPKIWPRNRNRYRDQFRDPYNISIHWPTGCLTSGTKLS